jgi:hypothetical protein
MNDGRRMKKNPNHDPTLGTLLSLALQLPRHPLSITKMEVVSLLYR